ncbi:MAG: class I SAM-dependent methyltransferase [FCB group bacterium]|nr:class I SAM-dependent methyltransferase [FCB group bacterium]
MTLDDIFLGNSGRKTVDPYEAIAPIYDRIMAHVEYDKWAAFIAGILREETDWPPKVLELACGTGIMAEKLAGFGLHVTGYDLSPAMIEQAKKKKAYQDKLCFRVGDFASFPQDEKHDAVICLYDSINYLMNYEEVAEFMSRAAGVLNPQGVFIFDICTRYNSYTNFRGFVDEGEIGSYYYFRHSNYSPKTHIHTNDFLLYNRSDSTVQYREHHEQYIYSVKQIQSAVKAAGLKLEMKYDDIYPVPARIKSLRIHFLCRNISEAD